MAKFQKVEKAIQLDLFDIVKFQLMSYCFLNKISLNETDYNILALLGIKGEMRLMEFCKLASDMKFMGSPTAINNCLIRLEYSRLYIKEGGGKKRIFLNPKLGIMNKGNLLLNYKFIRLEQTNTGSGNNIESNRTLQVE